MDVRRQADLAVELVVLDPQLLQQIDIPFRVRTTCQCGAGVSGILKSSDTISTSLLPSFVCIAVPVFAFTPWNLVVVCASDA